MNLQPFIAAIEAERLNVEEIVVFKQGREAARHCWNEGKEDKRRNIRSVAKSFVSIAVGMAIDEGKLALSDKAVAAFPPKTPREGEQKRRWDSLTLEHLLTMTMGHTQLSRPQSVDEAISYQLSRNPGSVFSYDNTCTFLVSAMLTKAAGIRLRDYLLPRLFTPLGIADPEWTESSDGYTTGGTDLFLSTREMAVFGQFLLQRGNWEGKQLVSAGWIDAATRAQVPVRQRMFGPNHNSGYGYCFWISPNGAFRCEGKDGQFIIIFPEDDVVVAINSNEENTMGILNAVWQKLICRAVCKAVYA